MWYGNGGDHKAGGSRLEKLEEMQSSGVLCDRRMPAKLKGRVYKTVTRPAIIYGAGIWATTKKQEKRIEINETRMLRWIAGCHAKPRSGTNTSEEQRE